MVTRLEILEKELRDAETSGKMHPDYVLFLRICVETKRAPLHFQNAFDEFKQMLRSQRLMASASNYGINEFGSINRTAKFTAQRMLKPCY